MKLSYLHNDIIQVIVDNNCSCDDVDLLSFLAPRSYENEEEIMYAVDELTVAGYIDFDNYDRLSLTPLQVIKWKKSKTK